MTPYPPARCQRIKSCYSGAQGHKKDAPALCILACPQFWSSCVRRRSILQATAFSPLSDFRDWARCWSRCSLAFAPRPWLVGHKLLAVRDDWIDEVPNDADDGLSRDPRSSMSANSTNTFVSSDGSRAGPHLRSGCQIPHDSCCLSPCGSVLLRNFNGVKHVGTTTPNAGAHRTRDRVRCAVALSPPWTRFWLRIVLLSLFGGAVRLPDG